ncbi:chromatin assembly factor 1 subunit A-like [Ptychodera flava]|uniref:chromatin assembly factor 1 subunit A-like n=1 Tax=Ptychodera flava TaxID=63121 RepID=UPI00396A6B4F
MADDCDEPVAVENLQIGDTSEQVIIINEEDHLNLGKTTDDVDSSTMITTVVPESSIVRDGINDQWTNVANEQIIVETPIDDETTEVVTSPIIEVQTSETPGTIVDDDDEDDDDDDMINVANSQESDTRFSKQTVKVKLLASQSQHEGTTTNLISGIEVLDTGSHFEWNTDVTEGENNEDNLLGLEGQSGQLIFIAQQPDTNTTSTQTEVCMRQATKRERDRIKKRELRRCPEFREREKERAKARMRAKREDPEYRNVEREKDRRRRRLSRQRLSLLRNMEKERELQWKRIIKLQSTEGLVDSDITTDT